MDPGPGLDGCRYSCFDPWTVHPVASCHTYYAIPARLVIPMRAVKHDSLSRLTLSVVED